MTLKPFMQRLAAMLALALLLTFAHNGAIGFSQNTDSFVELQPHVISVPKGKHLIEVTLHLTSAQAYSSADFGLSIEGEARLIKVNSLIGNKAQWIGPVENRGKYFFSFFSVENQFANAQNLATLTIEVSGDMPVRLALESVSITSVVNAPVYVNKVPVDCKNVLEISRNEVSPSPTPAPTPTPTPTPDSSPVTLQTPAPAPVPAPVESTTVIDELVPLGPAAPAFIDIENNWAKNYITFLANLGIIQGKSKTVFAPKDWITRADFTVLMVRTLEEKGPMTMGQTGIFLDVPKGAYYETSVKKAYHYELIKGVNGNFYPEAALSRQDMMVILHRAMLKNGYPFEKQVDLSIFNDANQIAPYARGPISELVAAGIIEGYANALRPLEPLKRDEVSKIIFLFREYLTVEGI